MQATQVHLLIVAAGKGSRFGGNKPKQYTQVHDKSILEHSVDKLMQSEYLHECHLVIAEDDVLAKSIVWQHKVNLIQGGEERWLSVKAGVDEIAKIATPRDLVLIHDAARPCVTTEDINKVIEQAFNEEYGAILATKVVDTLKQVYAQHINKTVDRTYLWQAQTPQVFRLQHLLTVLSEVMNHGLFITDEASGFEQCAMPIRIVEGSKRNIKLTYPDDLELIEYWLKP